MIATLSTQTATLRESQDRSASAIVSELDAHLAGMGQLTDSMTNALVAALRKHEVAAQVSRAQQMFGYGSEEYTVDGVTHRVTGQPLTLCDSSARASAAGAAVTGHDSGVRATTTQMTGYNSAFSSTTDTLKRYDDLEPEDYDSAGIMDDTGGLDAEGQAAADEWIKTVTNPLPAPQLDEKRRSTISGRAYERSRKILNTHLDTSQQALADLKADKAMTVPLGDEIANKWDKINPDHPVAMDANGMVSPLTVLRTEIEYRYASQEWTDRLADMQPRALLAELLTMKAIEMKIGYERYKMDREQLAMSAISYSSDARAKAKPELTRQREIARGVGVSGGDGSGSE
jgi:hypothetical protein